MEKAVPDINEDLAQPVEVVPVKKKRWRIPVAVLSFIVATITLLITKQYYSSVIEHNFNLRGIQSRPFLQLDFDRKEIEYKMQSINTFPIEELSNGYEKQIPCALTITTTTTLTNTGNSTAHILLEAMTDKNSGIDELRKAVIDENDSDLSIQLTESHIKLIDILPSEKYITRMPWTIQDISPDLSVCTLHYFCVYSNDFGNVFDSYMWIEFKVNPIRIEAPGDLSQQFKGLNGAIQVISRDSSNRRGPIPSTVIYSKKESEKILTWHRKHQETLLLESVK